MTDLRAPDLPKEGDRYGRPYAVEGLGCSGDENLDLVGVVQLLGREWRLITLLVTACALVAATAAYTMAPTYRAEALLAPVTPPKGETLAALGPLGDIASLVENVIGGPKDRTMESVAVLRSRSLALDFIREQKLKPLLFADRWDPVKSGWLTDSPPPSDMDAYELFHHQVRSVKSDRRTGLVTLSIEWTDPTVAARWANTLVRMVNARRRNDAVQEAQKSIEFLQRQLSRTSSLEVQQALYRLIEVQTKTIAVAQARDEYAFRVIDEALPPEQRAWPRRLLMIAVASMAGLVLSMFVVLVRHAVRSARHRAV
jgi:uncharacterized protein involved in exopolysaccharide biosynthesis